MTTAVYKLSTRKDSLVAHLRSTTPDEAIEKLQRAGVLAIHGPDDSSIILVGYHIEPQHFLEDMAFLGYLRRLDARNYEKKLLKATKRDRPRSRCVTCGNPLSNPHADLCDTCSTDLYGPSLVPSIEADATLT